MDTPQIPHSREIAEKKLKNFLEHLPLYAARRNIVDEGCTSVSQLSPYIRRRVLLEEEVIDRVLQEYPFKLVEKFIQEIVWRTYWKGWLESRPWVWEQYLTSLSKLNLEYSENVEWRRAVSGETSLPYFNSWVKTLTSAGYLHNHVRMWFASIWIFTFNLPWQLGAKFFLEHLLDGDPAVNTLSWRWVAGLQTVGKHYVATPENIRRFTKGRGSPQAGDLNLTPSAIEEESLPDQKPIPFVSQKPPVVAQNCAYLLHEEDLSSPDNVVTKSKISLLLGCRPHFHWAEHNTSIVVQSFIQNTFDDGVRRAEKQFGVSAIVSESEEQWLAHLKASRITHVLCYRPLTGFLAARIHQIARIFSEHGVHLHLIDREHDSKFFCFALRGFFPYWEAASKIIQEENKANHSEK